MLKEEFYLVTKELQTLQLPIKRDNVFRWRVEDMKLYVKS